MIDSFRNTFLSNFAPAPVWYAGLRFKSVEAAYQAAKSADPVVRAAFCNLTGAQAKSLGRRIEKRPDFDAERIEIMRKLLEQKFAHGSVNATRLLATGDQPLVEGNTWGDTFWGVCRGRGENNLGRLLMDIRAALQNHP